MRFFLVLVLFLLIWFVVFLKRSPLLNISQVPPISASPTPTKTSNLSGLDYPIADFRQRITKKFFGTYVTPSNSPISPERFTGYHTGVDIEYGDITADVPVYSIADGQIIYSKWTSGYGGLTVIKSKINNQTNTIIYGHLDPNSILPLNTQVKKGQKIGNLGQAYSPQTNGERKHLHFAIHKGPDLVILGYVQQKSQLSAWVDPLNFYP